MSHYANIFQMLMRLRQACDHPSLVLTRDRDATVPDTFLGDVEQARRGCALDVLFRPRRLTPDRVRV